MRSEPAMIIAAIEAGLVLAVAFGVPISPDQKVAVVGFASAVIALIGGILIRHHVTPSV